MNRSIITSKRLLLTIVVAFSINSALAQTEQPCYSEYFTSERLRIDLVFTGDANSQSAYLEGIHKEALWSGSKNNLIDPFEYGEYYYRVFGKDNRQIFSKGFNTLFQEWRTTAEAKKCPKAFYSSLWIPFPKEPVKMIVYERVKSDGTFREIYELAIDPKDNLISSEVENDFKITAILESGNPENKVDLVFIAEGYATSEMDKFIKDANKFAKYLFETEPYKSRKADFNIWAVESISKQSGTDIPNKNIWKNTVASSNFYTFRIDRYLTIPNQKTLAQIVSNAPCDAIYVIANTDKYGGGGIYNFYGISMSDNPATEANVFVHEFGHSFAGLADEYYTSEVAYEDFYNLKVEPWEPNITTLVNFDIKWKSMIDKDAHKNRVGLFEGGGYMAKGVFRPENDCRMKSNNAEGFCTVCRQAINRMIDYYTK